MNDYREYYEQNVAHIMLAPRHVCGYCDHWTAEPSSEHENEYGYCAMKDLYRMGFDCYEGQTCGKHSEFQERYGKKRSSNYGSL